MSRQKARGWLRALALLAAWGVSYQEVRPQDHDAHGIPEIKIGSPVEETRLTGQAEIHIHASNARGLHLQVYFDLVGLMETEVSEDHVQLTVTVDTAKYYDGEHLITTHLHGHGPGEFWLETRKVVSANNNPAPNGDQLLPQLELRDFRVLEFGEKVVLVCEVWMRGDTDASQNQVIGHIGESVLGIAGSGTLLPAIRSITFGGDLLEFQRDTETTYTAFFFAGDSVGRAQVLVHQFKVPKLQRRGYQLPRARIRNLSNFQELRLPTEFEFEISGIRPGESWAAYPYIGSASIGPGDGFSVDHDQVLRVPLKRDDFPFNLFFSTRVGPNATATAVWANLVPRATSIPVLASELPSSNHVHLNAIR